MHVRDKNKLLLNILIVISIISIATWIVLVMIDNHSNQLHLFFNRFKSVFSDFYNVLMFISGRDPYNNTIYSLGEKPYFPIAYVILYPFSKIGGFSKYTSLEECYTSRIGIFLVCIFTVLSVALFVYAVKKLSSKWNIKKKYLIPIFLSGTFISTLERGNLIVLSISLLLLFITYYDSDKVLERILAIIFISIVVDLKFYPVVFLVLYLKKDKKMIKELLFSIVGILFFALVPYLFFKGGFANIALNYRNIKINSSIYESLLDGYGFINFLNFIGVGKAKLISTIGSLVVFSSLIFSLFSKNKLKLLMSLFFVVLFVPSNSRMYVILHIVIIYLYVIKEYKDMRFSQLLLFVIYFALVFNPLQIMYNGYSLNETISFLATFTMFVCLYVSLIKDFMGYIIDIYRKRKMVRS